MREALWSAAAKLPPSGSSPYIEPSVSAQERRVATVSDFLSVGLFCSRSSKRQLRAAPYAHLGVAILKLREALWSAAAKLPPSARPHTLNFQ